MNLLKQNTDYGFRIVANLAINALEKPVSTKVLAEQEDISPLFTAKILQKLAKFGIVESIMGTAGGFKLKKDSSQISLYEIIQALQGEIIVNKCSPGLCSCPRQPSCPISSLLWEVEDSIIKKFKSISIADVIKNTACLKNI